MMRNKERKEESIKAVQEENQEEGKSWWAGKGREMGKAEFLNQENKWGDLTD